MGGGGKFTLWHKRSNRFSFELSWIEAAKRQVYSCIKDEEGANSPSFVYKALDSSSN